MPSMSAGSSRNQNRARGKRHDATGPYVRATPSRKPGRRGKPPLPPIPAIAASIDGPGGKRRVVGAAVMAPVYRLGGGKLRPQDLVGRSTNYPGVQGSAGTKARIVEAAMGLFWEHGYERTGIADITAAAGVRSGSLYHFFATKEDVLAGVLEFSLEALTPQVRAPALASTDDPVERIFAVLAGYRERILATEFRYRCPVG